MAEAQSVKIRRLKSDHEPKTLARSGDSRCSLSSDLGAASFTDAMQISQPLFRGHGVQPATGRLPPLAGLGHGIKHFLL